VAVLSFITTGLASSARTAGDKAIAANIAKAAAAREFALFQLCCMIVLLERTVKPLIAPAWWKLDCSLNLYFL
jgi:hypothetical protein